jgi:raffinose/stachyose/melibiose transport system permease protein
MSGTRRRVTTCAIKALLVVYCIFTAIPVWFIVINALKKPEYIYRSPLLISGEMVTLQSIVKAFRLMNYPLAITNNIVIMVMSLAVIILVGSIAAYGITISNSKTSNLVYLFIVLLITVPFQLIMIPLTVMLRDIRLLGHYLGTSLVYAVMSMPLVVFIYTGYMRTIPTELAEAAAADGCNLIKTYLVIYMPLARIATITVFIVRGVFIWNDLLIALVTIVNPARTTLVLRLYTFLGQRLSEWDMVCAGALLVSIPLGVLFVAFQKYFVQGMMAGSVKG